MPKPNDPEPGAAAVAGLLQAIADTLNVPKPAAPDDRELRQARVLRRRADHLIGVLRATLGSRALDDTALRTAAAVISSETAAPLPYEPQRSQT